MGGVVRAYEEPAIGGDRLEVSHADFERSCKVLLWEEQNKLDPSNAIVAVLCNAVRLSREHCTEIVKPRTDLLDRIKVLESEVDDALCIQEFVINQREELDQLTSLLHRCLNTGLRHEADRPLYLEVCRVLGVDSDKPWEEK